MTGRNLLAWVAVGLVAASCVPGARSWGQAPAPWRSRDDVIDLLASCERVPADQLRTDVADVTRILDSESLTCDVWTIGRNAGATEYRVVSLLAPGKPASVVVHRPGSYEGPRGEKRREVDERGWWLMVAVQAEMEANTAAAEVAYTRHIESGPPTSSAFMSRANVRYQLGDPRGAFSDFAAASDIDTTSVEASANAAATSFHLSDYSSCVTYATRALTLNPGDASLLISRGVSLVNLGHTEKGIEDLDGAIDIGGYDGWAYLWRAEARVELGDLRGAIQDYTSAIEAAGDFYDAYAMRAITYRDLGEWSHVLEDVERAVELRSPAHAGDHLLRARAHYHLGNFEKADSDIVSAIRLCDGCPLQESIAELRELVTAAMK